MRSGTVCTSGSSTSTTFLRRGVGGISPARSTPVITSVATGTVAENAAISTVVYAAQASDVDVGDTRSYSLSGTDAASFVINANTGEVTLKVSANYVAKASYSFSVIATDTGALTATQAVTLSVTTSTIHLSNIAAGFGGFVINGQGQLTAEITDLATGASLGERRFGPVR